MLNEIDFSKYIGQVCHRLCGEHNKILSKPPELRFGRNGSLSVQLQKGTWYDHENNVGGGVLDLIQYKIGLANGAAVEWMKSEFNIRDKQPSQHTSARIIAKYDYRDEGGVLLFQVCRLEPKTFRQRKPAEGGGWEWNVRGVRQVPYKLPEIVKHDYAMVFVVEGEKDADRLAAHGMLATCNAGGAGKWRREFGALLQGRDVVVLPDNDDAGRAHAQDVVRSLLGHAGRLRVLELPGLPEKGDVSDWLDGDGDLEWLMRLVDQAKDITEQAAPAEADQGYFSMKEFYAYLPMGKFIYVPTRELWSASTVNSLLPGIPNVDGKGKTVLTPASKWLEQNRYVEQMTWAPGMPELVQDQLLLDGGWVQRPGARVFNQYKGPIIGRARGVTADLWIEHIRMIYPSDVEHVLDWFAHRVQKPHEKLNHALVLGGAPGIGKDTILEPLKHAVGPWNFQEVSPGQIMGRFNGYLRCVVLRISETRDLGDVNRFAFHDHLKTLTSSPPDVLRVDEKYTNEYMILNVCGVIMTTNHKTDGVYIPEDDRRHFVAWSDVVREDERLGDAYWMRMYRYYADGGLDAVARYLSERDISGFDAKAPPPRTRAFLAIVDANRAPEEDELNDLLDRMGRPKGFTLKALRDAAEGGLLEWLSDRKNRRAMPHRLESCGYEPVRNPDAKDGMWKHGGERKAIYTQRELNIDQKISICRDMCARSSDK